MELFKLFGSVYVDNAKANQSISKTDSLAEKLGNGFAKVGKVVATGAVAMGTAVAGIGAAAVKSFGDFESSLNKVATIADPSVKSMEDIKKEVLKLSDTMGIAANDINEAMYQAISATGDTANSLKYVEQASKLAKGGFTDTSTALEAAAKTMNAYGESGEEAFTKIGDIMMQVQNQGITDIGKLSSSLSNVVPIAATLGVSFENVGAALATMTAQGTETSVATTQLRAAFTELSKSGTKASEEFQAMAGVTFQEFIEQGGNVSEAMQLMADSASKQGLTMMDLFSSTEAAQAALALTGAGAEKFATSMDAMVNASGATQEAYDKMSKGVKASFDKLINAGKNVLIQLGDKLAPLMLELAQWITDHMPQIQAVIEKTFNAVGVVVDIASKYIGVFIGWIQELVDQANTSGTEINKVWESIKSKTLELFESLKEFFNSFFEFCKLFWDTWGKTIMTIINVVWEQVKVIFDTTFSVINDLLNIFAALFRGDWEALWESVKSIVENVWNGIKELFGNALDGLIDILSDIVPRMIDAGKNMMLGLWDGIKNIWSNISDWVGEKVEWLVDKLTFWDNGTKKLENKPKRDGSHVNGLSYVPFNNYMAQLHVGEAVLTAKENDEYRKMKNDRTSTNVMVDNSETNDLLRQLIKKIDNLPRGMRNERLFV